jgi:nitrogen fixation protein
MIGNLILLPSMLISLEKYITKKDFPEPIMEIYEEDDEDNEEVEINEIEEKDKIY